MSLATLATLALIVIFAVIAIRTVVRSRPGLYDAAFYEHAHQSVERSAAVVVPLVVQSLKPRNVVDFGCGIGEWLRAFREAGVERVTGVDGPWVKKDSLLIDANSFVTANLDKDEPGMRGFDLAVSLETGEHLKRESSSKLVRMLTDAAPLVLFSAAVPGQGGEYHINERWPEFWAELFRARGYVPLEFLQQHILLDRRVNWYYRQNLIVYCSLSELRKRPDLQRFTLQETAAPLEWVHRSIQPPNLIERVVTWARARELTFGY